jgi:hypothetical protein
VPTTQRQIHANSGGDWVSECRNCGRTPLKDLGAIGKVYPFFLKRALGIELRIPRSPSAVKQKVRDIVAALMSLFSRVTSQSAFVEMQVCEHCSFIQTSIPFHDDEIKRYHFQSRTQRCPIRSRYCIAFSRALARFRSASLLKFSSC